MKAEALILSALLFPLAAVAFAGAIRWLEYIAFTYLPHGRLRSLLITGWTGTTPRTLAEMRAQRDR